MRACCANLKFGSKVCVLYDVLGVEVLFSLDSAMVILFFSFLALHSRARYSSRAMKVPTFVTVI